jgi:hypothetical protein
MANEVDALLERAAGWAARQADIRALALVGSWVRGCPGPSSDVDLVVLTEAPARYIDEDGWIGELGATELIRTAQWGALTERRVCLASGLEVDVGIARPSWADVAPADPGTLAVVRDGLRALHDPDGLLARLDAT